MCKVALVFWIAIAAATGSLNPRVCYQGWTKEKNRCYRTFMSPVTWQQAASRCQEAKSSLVILNDLPEQTFILSRRSASSDIDFWIGLKKNGSTWNLTDSSQTTSLFSVLNTSSATANQTCAVITKDGLWLPEDCNKALPFFCETGTIVCPLQENWHSDSDRCLKVMEAWPDMTWNSARHVCRNLSADLAVFNSLQADSFLQGQSGLSKWHWVGMQYNPNLLDYYWLDGTRGALQQVTTGAKPGVPEARCGAISVDSSSHDILPLGAPCSDKFGFICQLSFQADSCLGSAPKFVCQDGTCINATLLCDGVGNCFDGSDESPTNCGRSILVETSTVRRTSWVHSSTTTLHSSSTTPRQLPTAHTANADSSVDRERKRSIVTRRRRALSVLQTHSTYCKLLAGVGLCPTGRAAQSGALSAATTLPTPSAVATSDIYRQEMAAPIVDRAPIPSYTLILSSNGKQAENKSTSQHGSVKQPSHGGKATTASALSGTDRGLHASVPGSHRGYIAAASPRKAKGVSSATFDSKLAHLGNILGSSGVGAVNNGGAAPRAKSKSASGSLLVPGFISAQWHVLSIPKTTPSSVPQTSLPYNSATTSIMSGSTSTSRLAMFLGSIRQCFRQSATPVSDCLHVAVFTDDVMCSRRDQFKRGMEDMMTSGADKMSNSDSILLVRGFADVINGVLVQSRGKRTTGLSCDAGDIFENLEAILEVSGSFNATNYTVTGYSHIEIGVSLLEPRRLDVYRYVGHVAGCSVSNLSLTKETGKEAEIRVAIVLARMPHSVVKMKESDDGTVYLSSPLLSISAYAGAVKTSLRHDFRLPYTQKEDMVARTEWNTTTSTLHCAYYDPDEGEWDTAGCQVVQTDRVSVKCRCSHTTSFAILMQVTDIEIPEVHEVALSVITYIGCSVSLLTIFIALTVFTCVRSLNSERVSVHRNLCLAIIGSQVTFLAGIKAKQNMVVCRLVAVVLHYCYTAVFMWMLVEGLHLYTQVVQVFGTERSRVTYYLFFGWGVPLILVTISAVADWEGYGTESSCWLSIERSTVWAFVGPAIAVIIVNVVILTMVLRIVISSARQERQGRYDQIRAGIKGALFLLPLLGLTWVFGLLAVNEDLIAFEYLFAVFNSLQGFFIFLFHCALNSEVRQALQRMREKRALQNWDGQTDTCSSCEYSNSVSLDTAPPKPTVTAVRLKTEYVGGVKMYRPIQVAPLGTREEAPPTRQTRTDSRDSSRTKETDISNTGQSPDLTSEEDHLALIYI